MSPEDALDMHRCQLAENGTGEVLVRRYAGKGASRAVQAEAHALAKVSMYQPDEIVGAIQQGDRSAIVINDPDAVVPDGKVALSALLPLSTMTDTLVVSGAELAIQGIDDQSRRIRGVLVALELHVRG
jgi:hypothetical protein